jgi:hypothetical protein
MGHIKVIPILWFTIAALFAVASNADIPKDEIKAVLQANVNALAKQDAAAFAVTYAPNPSMIDDNPPYAWSGKNAVTHYFNDVVDFAKKGGFTDATVTVTDVTHATQHGKRIYAVFPLDISYKDSKTNTSVKLQATETVVFQKSQTGKWLIKSSSWAQTD